MTIRLLLWLSSVLVCAPALADDYEFPAGAQPSRRLVIGSTTDIGIIRPVIEAWQAANPAVSIRYRELTTNTLFAEAQAACKGDAPADDVVLSSAMDLQIKLASTGYALAYRSVEAGKLPAWAVWKDMAYGTTFEPAAIVYNKRLVSEAEVPKKPSGPKASVDSPSGPAMSGL